MPEPSERLTAASRKIGSRMLLLAWLLLFALLIYHFHDKLERQHNPNPSPTLQLVDGKQHLVLQANRHNHFVSSGEINGQSVTFLLDTGATLVAIPADMAARLQLKKGRRGHALTANGRVTTYLTHIDQLRLGHLLLRDVVAEINPGMNGMGEVLLGMSALSQIEFSQRNGQLTLSLPAPE